MKTKKLSSTNLNSSLKSSTGSIALAENIFSIPTAPYYEKFVLKELKQILSTYKIPCFFDASGNLIAGAKNSRSIKPNSIAYVAHTDHPGFHITAKLKKTSSNKTSRHKTSKSFTYKAMWYGGAPFQTMEGAKVRIHDPDTGKISARGIIQNFPIETNHREGIPFEIKTTKAVPTPSFGAFDFDGYKLLNNNIISTKAADDLAGCVMALAALIKLYKKAPVLAIFTRAEEVGFIGCLGLIQKKVLPASTQVISLEASRTLPGALLGSGPVIRLGDASTLFDSNFSLFIQKCARNLKLKDSTFVFQKRIMDGGSCEATAFSQFGFKTMGLAVPLDNYHNMGKKGPAPEKIHKEDLENGTKLLIEVGKSLKLHKNTGPELRKKLLGLYKTSQKLLRDIDAV